VQGELVAATGTVPREICSRARWTDLVVTNLAYPPGTKPLARLSSGFRTLVQRCPAPLLATPGVTTGLEHALLAFDGSPKAEEALFIAAYLAGRWQVRLEVLSVSKDERAAGRWLEQASSYLDGCGVQAGFHMASSPVAETVLRLAGETGCDLIIMGGYGYNPLLEVVLGSALDGVLQESNLPVLICR
jgi:nucleotide-binding universal stress UspA family protein